MKLLVVDECCFTRVGIASHFTDNMFMSVKCCPDIDTALPLLASFKPSHILVNLTNYCRYTADNQLLSAFISAARRATLHIYLDVPYPYGENPLHISSNTFLFSKTVLPNALATLTRNPSVLMKDPEAHSLFSPQELTVMRYWMSEMPNYRIAKKLQISSHTVYVHKRHITEKINVRNRLEFYSLYNILRYFYPPEPTVNAVSSTSVAMIAAV